MADIFVIDDEPLIAGTTAAILKLHGYSSVFFTNPHDAIEAAKCGCPRLLISDLIMPEMPGMELAIKAKEICADCGVILFTGQMIGRGLHDEVSRRGFLILQKPTPAAELILAVETMLGL